MNKRTLRDLSNEELKGKKVFVRVDFNVPQNKDLTIADDTRIKAALPTINYLKERGARIILASHLGRPKPGADNSKYSLKPIAQRLSSLLKQEVHFAGECSADQVASKSDLLKDGEVFLLENVRFNPSEEANDQDFCKQLAELADIYVNDAFGTAHRAHASTCGITRFLKPAIAGFLMEKEIQYLSNTLKNPTHPFVTIIGGSKVSSKIGVLENLLDKVDALVIGGAMAFSFLKAQGFEVGKSLVESDRLEFCAELLVKAKAKNVQIVLPVDVVCGRELKPDTQIDVVDIANISPEMIGLDLGPKSIEHIDALLSTAKTIIWNGPLGAFETKGFEKATYALAKKLSQLTAQGVTTIIGGGDSVAAIEACGLSFDKFSHVSTGGGASLELLEGIELPGLAALDDATTVAGHKN